MRCPSCNTESREGARFCRACGSALGVLCANCGVRQLADSQYCDSCGARVPGGQAPAQTEVDATAVKALRRLAPSAYAERLLAAGGQLAGERRLVTILFSDVKGSTALAEGLDPEDVMEIMDGAFDVLIEPIMRHEGTLARLMGDAILAFFGAPIAHEDDPERASRAALEIVEGAGAYAARLERERGITGFNVRVGINTGLVVVGEVGSDLRVEYTAMGDAINLAARMEQHAPPGSILITHDTYRHIRGVFDVQPQEPLLVKGKVEPIQTYVVLRAKPRAFRLPTRGVEGIETRMIGREAELKRLQDGLYEVIEDSERQVITIIGEAGVGKSRLLYEFDNWIELLPQTVRYFKGRARQEMHNLPYALLRDLFAFRFQIQDSDSAVAVREKMVAGIGEVLAEDEEPEITAHLIGQLIGYDFSDSPHLHTLRDDPQTLHRQALACMERFFAASCRLNPTVILLEDLHWADDSSLTVINHLAETLPRERLLMVAAARPSLFDGRPHWGEGQAFHTRLELKPLSRHDGRRLVSEILQKVEEIPDTLRDLVVSGAEGNPFFIEELIKMLIEDDVIVKGPEMWQVESSRLTEVRVPESLTGVLQARMDRLPLEERTALQQASVVGRLFWDRAVAHISKSAPEGLPELDVTNTLVALREREMVFRRETSVFADAREFVFKHALLREIAYASLLKRLCRLYHGLVADWLVAEAGDRVGEITGLIADHLEAAGRTDEALERLLEAGDHARLLYAQDAAIGYYERALALLREAQDPDKAARTLMKLGLTYHTAFEFRRSRQAYDEAFSLWQQAASEEPIRTLPDAPHALRLPLEELRTLDPSLVNDSASMSIIHLLFAGLLRVNAQLDIVPDLALSWEVSEGGRRYVFHLRDDARWSDGLPVTAQDCAYGARRTLDPVGRLSMAGTLYGIKGARDYCEGRVHDADAVGLYAPDQTTLVVELDEPIAYALHVLAQLIPVPSHVVEVHNDAWTELDRIVTSGPFGVEDWQPGQSMTLVRNPDYHGQVRGNVKRIELRSLSHVDPANQLRMYRANELDALDLPHGHVSFLDEVRRRHVGEYISTPCLATTAVQFHTGRPPFDNQLVRQAFAMAIDRETLANVVVGGTAVPATGGFLPPQVLGHSPGIGLPHDIAGAQRLMADAGYPGGRYCPVVEGLASTMPVLVRTIEYLVTCWHDALGVDVACRYVDGADVEERWTSDPPHFGMLGWAADYPDPDNFMRVAVEEFGPWDWKDDTYDRLVDQAKTTTAPGDRVRLYREADRILMQSAAIVPLYYPRRSLLLKPWLRNYAQSTIRSGFWEDIIIDAH